MNNQLIALIRCDASTRVGYGHLMRCMALADTMRATARWTVIFAIAEDDAAAERVRAAGFTVEQLYASSSLPSYASVNAVDHLNQIKHVNSINQATEGEWLQQMAERHQASVLVLDVRSSLSRADVSKIRHEGTLIVSIDDISERRLEADLAFYPPIPQVDAMDWSEFSGQLHSGWDWIMMPAKFAAQKIQQQDTDMPHALPRLLVTMGGSDPAGLTFPVIEALEALPQAFDTRIVTGSAFAHQAQLHERLKTAQRHYTLISNPADMPAVMADTDLAIASFGATAYELACLGIPAVHLCLSADHASSASSLHQAGAARVLGEYKNISVEQIRAALENLLIHPEQLIDMRERSHDLIDGCGLDRILHTIETVLEADYALSI